MAHTRKKDKEGKLSISISKIASSNTVNEGRRRRRRRNGEQRNDKRSSSLSRSKIFFLLPPVGVAVAEPADFFAAAEEPLRFTLLVPLGGFCCCCCCGCWSCCCEPPIEDPFSWLIDILIFLALLEDNFLGGCCEEEEEGVLLVCCVGEVEEAACMFRGLDSKSSRDMETVLPGVPLFAREGVLARLPPPPALELLWCTMVGKRSVRRRCAELTMKPPTPPESNVSPSKMWKVCIRFARGCLLVRQYLEPLLHFLRRDVAN